MPFTIVANQVKIYFYEISVLLNHFGNLAQVLPSQ